MKINKVKKITTEEFIIRCEKQHENKYDYSLCNYINGETIVSIICPTHGIFKQKARTHMSGSNCKLCVNNIKSNKNIFIENFQKIHGKKYNYNLVNYKNCRIKVCIICPVHGIFYQTPSSHLSGSGCPKCPNNYSSKENFIKKSIKIHGNKYDYSLVDYINSHTKVKIICPKHKIFEQLPYVHLKSGGCSICSKNQLTTEEFIKRCEKKHDNKYDYSLVNYKNINTRVKIICPEHGIFEQIPSNHLSGGKCPICNNPTSKFIEKCNSIHNNKYDYRLINYKDNKTKIKIICPIHGIFEQCPNNHHYNGCPKCGGVNKTTEDFIYESKKIHNDKYDYSLSIYDGTFNKLKIICPKHGIFIQSADNHLRGKGCPICNESKGEIKIRKILKQFNISFTSQKRFKYCSDIKSLPFDFYLPEHNICIEYDGIQHFESIKYFGGEKSLFGVQKRDQIKNEYCKNNNIKLIRIKNIKQIENVLKKELNING